MSFDLKQLYQGFRDADTVLSLAEQIKAIAPQLPEPLKVMEVCGGHTHTIMKYGLKGLVAKKS